MEFGTLQILILLQFLWAILTLESDEILNSAVDVSVDGITYQLEEQTLSSLPKDIASLSAEQIIALTSDETKKELLVLLTNHFKIPLPEIRCWFKMEEISNPKEVFGFLINVKTEWNRGKVGYTVTTDGHWTSFSAFNTMKSQGKVVTAGNGPASHFWPMFVHQDHHARADWMSALRVNLENIHGINGKGLDFNCVDIFSSLVNQLFS